MMAITQTSEESVDIHDGWLWGYVDEYDDNLIKINPIAYHYVDFFWRGRAFLLVENLS